MTLLYQGGLVDFDVDYLPPPATKSSQARKTDSFDMLDWVKDVAGILSVISACLAWWTLLLWMIYSVSSRTVDIQSQAEKDRESVIYIYASTPSPDPG